MAKTEPEDDDDAPAIYKHASSKKLKAVGKGQQEAKKGDVKSGKDIDVDDADPDAEYESVGTSGREEGDPERISDNDVHEGARDVFSKASPQAKGTRVDRNNEWWRKRTKPTS